MSLKRLNLILGWVVFAAALLVYGLTMEKTASFWDCGEFIAAAHKLQIVHPPGAPLYLMLGRLFSFFLPPDQVALGVNFLSSFSTALAGMFVFWSTTILAKRILNIKENVATNGEIIAVLGAGLVAAFAFIFQDSQWFNAVEAEVYAVSTGLTAAVIYMALKWSEIHEKPGADRWLMGIALVIGLSIGVHLLNLLAIPAIALLYYFYKRETFNAKGIAIAFVIGALILLFVQYGVILELPKLASGFEILFVNSFGLPFGSGLFFMVLLVFAIPVLLVLFAQSSKSLYLYITLGIIGFLAISQFFKVDSVASSFFKLALTAGIGFFIYTQRDKKQLLYKVAMAFGFIMIGYLTYLFVPIRSSANTPIDINNPDNVFSMLSYLNREQYGDRPLAYGPVYTAEVQGTKTVGKVYAKKGERYEVVDNKIDYEFLAEDQMLFPRAWDFREERKADAYKAWLNIGSRDPSVFDNLKFFFTHQLDFMYWRYFMWNFAGKQNGEQSHGEAEFGNWESGISVVDYPRVLQAEVYPEKVGNNPSKNHFYLIPFVFGVLGLILQWRFARKDAITIIGLFLLTGVAIVVYLNQEPLQPRERDYAYVGSFLAFAVWIGLSVAGLYRVAKSMVLKEFTSLLTTFSVIFLALILLGFGLNNPVTLLPIALVALAIIFLVYTLATLMKKMSGPQSAIVLTVLAMSAPILMGAVGWKDHNRHQLHLARAVGANYLTSCNQDAILFTEGDNDTYPLWYAQEVENVRPDIRIVNNSLLKADWYANQVRQPNGNQPGLEFTLDPEDYESGKREVIYLQEQLPEISLKNLIRVIKDDSPRTKVRQGGSEYHIFPSKTFTLAIDKEAQVRNGLVTPEEAEFLVDTMIIRLGKGNLVRDEFMIYDLIQQNINKRPIYFTGENLPNVIGFSPYTRREASSIRLVPILNPAFGSEQYSPFDPPIAKEKTLEFFKNEMDWGNIESGVYLEETGQRQIMRVLDYATIMMFEFADAGEGGKAMETYGFIKDYIFASSVPKDEIYFIFKSTGIIDALLQLGENEEAYEVAKRTINSSITQLRYLNSATHPIANDQAISNEMIRVMEGIQSSAEKYENEEILAYLENELSSYGQ